MKNPDEDFGYEMERQRKVDETFVKFGGALKQSEWVQKSVNKDPRPDLPFEEDKPFDMADRYVGYACVALAVGCLIILWVYHS